VVLNLPDEQKVQFRIGVNYQRAMRLSPMYPSWYAGTLENAYRLLGRYDEAIASLNSYIKRDPEDVRIARAACRYLG